MTLANACLPPGVGVPQSLFKSLHLVPWVASPQVLHQAPMPLLHIL